ncbi:MAG: gamma-glutamyl-gamma-aminobutyrate hydrolase family protein, partial [Gemmatimonadales bacterium]
PESWVMNQRYFLAATASGAVPWMVPLLHDDPDTLREIYERLDGILIPGGVDLSPETYGADPSGSTGRVDPARDSVELQLTRWAIEDSKPVLGLCRGAQIINVACGGTLYQDLAADYPGAIKHDYFPTAGYDRSYLAHEVSLTEGSRLATAMEQTAVAVNSMHHQGIRTLGRGLVPVALAPDGLVEGIELEGRGFVVGVQWHPEIFEPTDEHTRSLFREFLAAANSRR